MNRYHRSIASWAVPTLGEIMVQSRISPFERAVFDEVQRRFSDVHVQRVISCEEEDRFPIREMINPTYSMMINARSGSQHIAIYSTEKYTSTILLCNHCEDSLSELREQSYSDSVRASLRVFFHNGRNGSIRYSGDMIGNVTPALSYDSAYTLNGSKKEYESLELALENLFPKRGVSLPETIGPRRFLRKILPVIRDEHNYA